jgi:cephalosporin hydroxylase
MSEIDVVVGIDVGSATAQSLDLVLACQATWIKELESLAIPYYFFFSETRAPLDREELEGERFIFTGLADSQHRPGYAIRSRIHMLQHLFREKANFYLLVNADNYLSMSCLLPLLKKYESDGLFLIGGLAQMKEFGYKCSHSSGKAGLLFSYGLLQKLFAIGGRGEKPAGGSDAASWASIWQMQCQSINSTHSINDADLMVAHNVLIGGGALVQERYFSSASWNQIAVTGFPVGGMHVTCSGMNPEDMRLYEHYKNNVQKLQAYIGVVREYDRARNIPSDIFEHIETLYKYGRECRTIVECGVRTCVSTWAFTRALLENNILLEPKQSCRLVGVDLMRSHNIAVVETLTSSLGLSYQFWEGNDLEYPITEMSDMIFIDTWHVYGHLLRELRKFAPFAGKYIIMHDTTVDEYVGESVRCHFDVSAQVITSGMSRAEIIAGLWPAVEQFLFEAKEFVLEKRYANCNGLTVLRRVAPTLGTIPITAPPLTPVITHMSAATTTVGSGVDQID